MPTIVALAIFAGLFLLASRSSSSSAPGRAFPLEAGKRYRLTWLVTPALDVATREPVRLGLTALGFEDVAFASATQRPGGGVAGTMRALAPGTVTRGEVTQLGGHSLSLESIQELAG